MKADYAVKLTKKQIKMKEMNGPDCIRCKHEYFWHSGSGTKCKHSDCQCNYIDYYLGSAEDPVDPNIPERFLCRL